MLDDTDHGRLEAEREWMFEAEKLVEMFRETRMLFLATRVCLQNLGYVFLNRSADDLSQTNPFRGMLCRRPAVKRDDQADEDRMATRLELMGKPYLLGPVNEMGPASQLLAIYRTDQ